jgi:hypothetical protein
VAYYLFNFTQKGAEKGRTLREQATELLEARLWGIGDKTANRDVLAPGDHVLIYVGAPEREFIGHAVLDSGTHAWSPAEAQRYPGDFSHGVAFSEAHPWPSPVALG